jgi:hypothetical protein
MTNKQKAVSLVKRFQEANPTIRKSKEEGIASAIVAVDLLLEYIVTESKPDWLQVKEYLYNL